MEKNNGKKENFFEKVYRVQKENEVEEKRIIEKIKEDKLLQAYIMNMYYVGFMFAFCILILYVYLIFLNDMRERLASGITALVFSVAMMIVYYVRFIKPLKK